MLRTAWEHLDNGDLHPLTWRLGKLIKKAVPLLSPSSRKLAFGNGSVARCSTSLRGTTPQRVHISELGKTAIWAPIKAREIINGAFNSLTPGNVRNIESTHEGGKMGEHFRLLNNAMRHAHASVIEIVLITTPDLLRVSVADNGSGMPEKPPPVSGIGLRIMQYRCRSIAGTFQLASTLGRGTTVTCTVPAERPEPR